MKQNPPAVDNGFSNALSVIEEIRHPLWNSKVDHCSVPLHKSLALILISGRSADECAIHIFPPYLRQTLKAFVPTIFSFSKLFVLSGHLTKIMHAFLIHPFRATFQSTSSSSTYIYIYRVSREKCARLRENVP
jgi:hypothetical protein